MFDVILALTLSFAISFLAIPVIIRVAAMKKLYDLPDERKVHQAPIPALGGLGIFAGFAFSTLLVADFQQGRELQYFLAASLVIYYLGLKDDIIIISPVKKFIGQVLAAFIVIYFGNIQIDSMHGLLGIHGLPQLFSLVFTYLTVIVIINSFNLIDGVDGLAGSLGFLSSSVFGIYFVSVGYVAEAVMAFSMAGSILAFLIFNFQPARIFMGDTGSLLIGLINAILVIRFITVATTPDISLPIAAAPAVGFGILMVPLLDTLRVFAIRIFQRRSPFSPDRNHIHHLFLDNGFSHRSVAIILLALNAITVGLAFAFHEIGNNWLMGLLFGIFFTIIGAMYIARQRRPRLFVTQSAEMNGKMGKAKIVPLTEESVLQQK